MKLPGKGAMRSLQGMTVLILALFSSAAMALGLGNIRVLSKPGQPLVAEIPVITADPGELDNARAGLAAPATFERVGLPPPEGLVSELQFQFAQDREGRAVIRVTSAAPVQVPSVGFLIEVDWGQGRLVREYSALVAAPEAATAVAEPVIDAPAAAPSNLIVREPEPLPQAPIASPQAEAAPATAPVAPVAAPQAAARPSVAPAPRTAGELAPVQRGQSLSQIAGALTRENGYSLNQNMVALMRANPEAFIRGNVNLLKQGAVLRTPAEEELARVDAAEARSIVREQTAQWRQARAPIPQPAIANVAAVATPAARNQVAAAASDARLEIAPAVAGDQQTAGMTTGLDAGGEGDMLANEQLQQAREELATRDAEMQELRGRVAELEKLQKQQQSLIAMKDSDLAAAQQRLAESNRQEVGTSLGWLWLGLVLLVLGIVAWLLSRRRKPSPLKPTSRDGFSAESLASAVPVSGAATESADDDVHTAGVVAPAAFTADTRWEEPVEPVNASQDADAPSWLTPEVPVAAEPPATTGKPLFMFEASRGYARPQEAPVQSEPAVEDEERWAAGDMAAVAPLNPAPAGRERLELAIAYLDLGDAETARTLLNEVAVGSDSLARNEALELLNRLG